MTAPEPQQKQVDELCAALYTLLPMYGPGWNWASVSAITRPSIAKILFYNEVYQKIVDVPGVICEFGVHWGGLASLLINLRGMYEPFNISRTYHGFDTFDGFPSVSVEDGSHGSVGDFKTIGRFQDALARILQIQELMNGARAGFELVKGDASETVPFWLESRPHAIIALAVLDFDLYKPTKDVLQAIMPRLVKGSVLVFDELNHPDWPGETTAVQEILGLNNLRLHRFPHHTYGSFAIFGE